MPAQDRSEDPRWIVTPDAFSVDPDLLGRPLAQHGRRLAAILLDLLLIAMLTQLPGFILGLLAALFFFRMAMRRKQEEPPTAMRRVFRGTVGCFGGIVLLITAIAIWGGVRGLVQSDRRAPLGMTVGTDGSTTPVSAGLLTFIGGMQEVSDFRRATDADEAERLAGMLAARLRAVGLTEGDDIREFLLEAAPVDAEWRGAIEGWELAPGAGPSAEGDGSAAGEDEGAGADGPGEVAGGDSAEAGEGAVADSEEADLGDDAPEPTPAEQRALDSLSTLETRFEAERRERERAERALAATQRDLEVEREGGLVLRFLRRVADDMGLGIGWAALYFSFFMVRMKGQTPGKRAFRLRVVRLDGKPMTWWIAFERYGGYAAGFATGLLGFAQVYWDPNRQAIHDRIAGTAVIQDGKPPVPGLWHLTAPTAKAPTSQPPPPSPDTGTP